MLITVPDPSVTYGHRNQFEYPRVVEVCSLLLKPLPYLWPKSVIFPTPFIIMTWWKIQYPIYLALANQ